uniref:hypothetical protein n=1 Tax=Streptococcus oralis TaxID=1303 RepID=UPI001BD5069E
AVKQANLDAETEAAVVGALTRAAGGDSAAASPPPPESESGDPVSDALELSARARLAIMERMGN